MSEDIKEQVIIEINKSVFGLFSIQLDESVDVSSVSQLMVFVRYAVGASVKKELLFCSALNTSTKASDVLEKVDHFFNENKISWNNLCGVCTDGAPAMLGSKSGFRALVQSKATGVIFTHCFIHREALASKTLLRGLQDVLNITIKIVNFVKSSSLHTRLFKKLCEDMESEHKNLLYYTKVRWLSKGNILSRVFELRDELKIYLNDTKPELAFHFTNAKFIACLAYVVDIFHSLNTLNLKMQGKEKNIILNMDSISAFVEKLAIWRRKAQNGNFSMFNNLSDISEMNDELKTNVVQHLKELESEFKHYFPEVSGDDLSLARNPSPENVEDELQDLKNLKNDSSCRDLFETLPVTEFWLSVASSYPEISKIALKKLLAFSSTWLCESAFSALVCMKSKQRNRLDVEHDIRCALSTTEPRISKLVAKAQEHPSH